MTTPAGFTLQDARAIARKAHAGQTDKLGVPYIAHVEAVASGVADFDLDIQVAAMLHDVVDDSDLTLDDLREAGVSERSLDAIAPVSRNLHPELSYQEGIERICESRDAALVKISDNAHNSLASRNSELRAPHRATDQPAIRGGAEAPLRRSPPG